MPWKHSVLKPLLKGTNLPRQEKKNFRPVSNVLFLSKVLEKVALEQIHRHCEDESLLPDYQSAYHPGYSCETALAKINLDLLWAMETQQVTAMIFLDLSAAFDTVDHQILHTVFHDTFNIYA